MIRKLKLKDIGTVITGNTPSKKIAEYYNSNDINFFTPTDFEDCKINELKNATNYISNNAKEKARILPKDSVLVTCIGIIGKVGIIERESAFNQQINAIIPNKDIIYNRYLAYWLISKAEYLRKRANAPVVPIINKTDFQELEIDIPDIDIQKEIANKLDKIAEVLKSKKQQIKQFDKIIKSQFVEMFGELSNSKYSTVKLSSIAVVSSSHRVFTTEFVEKGIPFYRGTEIGMLANGEKPKDCYYISKEHYSKICDDSTKPKIGDLLLPSICNKGQVWMVDTIEPFYYKDGRVLSISPKEGKINNKYFHQFMKYKTIKEYSKLGSGSTFAEFKIFILKDFDVILPPLELQNQFAEIVKQINKQKNKIENSLKEMEELYESLIRKYFG